MISFVWSAKYPFLAGAGGSENYTAGQIRELQRRGIECRVLTLGHGENDGRNDFPHITFKALKSKEELVGLDDTIVFVTYPLNVRTKKPSYAILHCPPPTFAHGDAMYSRRAFRGKRLIATSRYAAGMWRRYLGLSAGKISVVYPFAEKDFSLVQPAKTRNSEPTRILFAGRLTPDKGVYTLLAALHMEHLSAVDYTLTTTTAGEHTDEGKLLLPMLKAHPEVTVVPSAHTSREMAKLMAANDIVVMPSSDLFWKEMFGIVSVEAQHSGCRVVASRSGGLPETNCGGLMLTKPDDPKALAATIAQAAKLGRLSAFERAAASRKYSVESSVDSLLKTLGFSFTKKKEQRQTVPLRRGEGLLPRFSLEQPMLPDRWKPAA